MIRQLWTGILASGLLLGGTAMMPAPQAPAVQKGKKGLERHPHIRHAIRELRQAKQELKTAAHDFGGHRVEAIKAIDVAITQLELALKFDKR